MSKIAAVGMFLSQRILGCVRGAAGCLYVSAFLLYVVQVIFEQPSPEQTH